MKRTREIKGVYPVIPTPFNQEGEFDIEAKRVLRQVIDYAIEKGAHGIITCGGASEWFALTESERKEITDITVNQVKGRVQVFIGGMSHTTKDTIMYSKYAEAAGADGVMIDPPPYSIPLDDELYKFYGDVATAVDIQIMIYNQPESTNVDMSPELIARLVDFDNITCLKESSMDLARVGRLKELCGDKLAVLWGAVPYVLDALLLGAKGLIAVCATLPFTTQMCDAVEKGNIAEAKEIWDKIRPIKNAEEIERDRRPTYYVRRSKAALELLGFQMGPPRLPILPASKEEREVIRQNLISLKIL